MNALSYEPAIRLGAFVVVLVLLSAGEALVPRRNRAVTRRWRWPTNITLVVLNTFLVRVAFPVTSVGMAVVAEQRGWGLLHAVGPLPTLLPIGNWGNYVYAKINAVPLFEVELAKLRRAGRAPSILLSSVTDAYQGAEKKYRLTRAILEVLAREPYPGVVGILTKSPLVLRDADLLATIPRAHVGLTVTTTDDRPSRFLELRAPLASRRLETLAALNARGIETYAFVGPLLPHFRYDRDALDTLFAGLARAGVRSLYVEHINLRPYIQQRMQRALRSAPSEVQAVYRDARSDEHRRVLDAIVAELLAKHELPLRLSRVLYHQDL